MYHSLGHVGVVITILGLLSLARRGQRQPSVDRHTTRTVTAEDASITQLLRHDHTQDAWCPIAGKHTCSKRFAAGGSLFSLHRHVPSNVRRPSVVQRHHTLFIVQNRGRSRKNFSLCSRRKGLRLGAQHRPPTPSMDPYEGSTVFVKPYSEHKNHILFEWLVTSIVDLSYYSFEYGAPRT
ncbi:hypothetical protein V8C42DRAFT_45510 [Trichoderma barbatum]